MAQACVYTHSARWKPSLDRTLFHCRAHSHPYSLRLGQFRHMYSSNVHSFWDVGGNRSPKRKPSQTKFQIDSDPGLELMPPPSHQHYNEMTSNEMTLLKDLLYLSLMGITFLLNFKERMFIECVLCYTVLRLVYTYITYNH